MESRSRFLSLAVAVLAGIFLSCDGYGMYGMDLHHRFSDPVKGILGFDEAPEKGSWHYYKVLADGDRFHRGRHLASSKYQSPLIFSSGNETIQLGGSFGFLHYANISIGTPSSSYLVALDTGSDLFWLPCDCHDGGCVRGIKFSDGRVMKFSEYSTNTSTTGSKVSCDNSMCAQRKRCASDSNPCPYQVVYLSNGTSSTGVLVQDVLHLTTDESKPQTVDAPITFGCGRVQTGTFMEGAAPNGLIGLGIEDIAVPTLLAKNGFTSDSFSMCFGSDRVGRIRFGDNGTADQSETPFNLRQSHPTYNLTVTQISVGGTTADLEFHAIYDSGTSFTYLNDPAYTQITESFNLQTKEDRHRNSSNMPFEYCYDLGPNQESFLYPPVNLTMKGGQDYAVNDPLIVVSIDDKLVYCLAVIKSEDINLIGQNFMTGYRVIFDREKLVLGWKKSNCYEDEETTMTPLVKSNSPAISPVSSIDPEATSGTTNKTVITAAGPSRNHSTKLTSFTYLTLLLVLSPLFLMFL